MTLDLANYVPRLLKQKPGQKFTAREIAQWILETYQDECREKQRLSIKRGRNPLDTDDKLLKQIVAEIGSVRPRIQKRHPEVKTTEDRPQKFYFTQATDSAEIDYTKSNQVSSVSRANKVLSSPRVDEAPPASNTKGFEGEESALYPILYEFLLKEYGIYSMRIDERKSRNKRGKDGNKWIHPDLVGLENLSHDWHSEIKECVKEHADKKARLWSFEVKKSLPLSELRQAFFQAVSNSSWANFGYLVASENPDSETMKELHILSSLHGIGFIELNADNPSESQIIIPARERSDVDWDTANRLIKENDDFLEYIMRVRKFYRADEINESRWKMKMK